MNVNDVFLRTLGHTPKQNTAGNFQVPRLAFVKATIGLLQHILQTMCHIGAAENDFFWNDVLIKRF